MKKRSFKPGYEFIFSLCILAILGLPPLVSAQSNNKDMDITIVNGDTTVNGKNIKDLSGKDRMEALTDIGNISSVKNHESRKMRLGRSQPRMDNGMDDAMLANGGMGHKHKDSSSYTFHYKMNMNNGQNMDMSDHRSMDRGDRMRFEHRNTKNFIYTSTDNDGITTRVSFHVSDHFGRLDADATDKEKIQMDMLNLMDLNLVPEYSTGKVLLMFTLPSKVVASVKLKDSKGNVLWREKATNGKFSTLFAMGLNGTYYLQVKQADKVIVKQIVKE